MRATSRAKSQARLTDGIAFGFELGNSLRRFGRQLLASRRQRRQGALFEIRRAGFDLDETPLFRLVTRHCGGEGEPATLQRGARLADLLIEDQQGVAIDHRFLGLGGCAAGEEPKQLEHGVPPAFERCSHSWS